MWARLGDETPGRLDDMGLVAIGVHLDQHNRGDALREDIQRTGSHRFVQYVADVAPGNVDRRSARGALMEDDIRVRRTDEVFPKDGTAVRYQWRKVLLQVREETVGRLETEKTKIGTMDREREGARAQVRPDVDHHAVKRERCGHRAQRKIPHLSSRDGAANQAPARKAERQPQIGDLS